MTRTVPTLVCVLLCAWLPACDDDGDPTGPIGSVAGTWRLRTVDDAELPAEQFVSSLVRPSGCDVQTLRSSLLTLRQDETFTITFDLDIECDGIAEDRTITFQGTYDRIAQTVQFTTVDLIEFDAAVGPDGTCGGPALAVDDTIFQLELLYCPT